MINFKDYQRIGNFYRQLVRALGPHGRKLSSDPAKAMQFTVSPGNDSPISDDLMNLDGFKGSFAGEENGIMFEIGIVGNDIVMSFQLDAHPVAIYYESENLQEFVDEQFAQDKPERTWKITLTGEPDEDNTEEADDAFAHEITVKGRSPIDAWRNAIKEEPDKFEYGIEHARFERDGLSANFERGAPKDEEFYYHITFEQLD